MIARWNEIRHAGARRGFSVLLALALIWPALAFAGPESVSGDWPNFLGPNYDGISHETNWSANWPEEGPKVAWKIDLGAGGSCPAISKGRIYTMGYINGNDTVYCLDE